MKEEIKNKSLLKPEALLNLLEDLEEEKEKLKLSENNLNKAQQMAHIGNWRLDVKTKVVSGSKELFNIFEIPSNHPSLETFVGVVYSKDKEFDWGKIERGMKYGEPWNIKHRLLMKDKRVKWVHAKGEAIKNKKGEIVKLIGTVQDITEKKKAEEALEESEKRHKDFSKIFEDSLNEIYIFDAKTFKFISVNKGAIKNLGYSMKELENLTPLDLKKQITSVLFNKLIKPLKEGKEEIIKFETTHRRKNGTFYNVEVHLQLTSFGNRPVFVAIILDITEKKKAEEALKESEERYRDIFENANDLIQSVDSRGRFIYVNKKWKKLLGYTDEEIKKFTFRNIIKKEHIPFCEDIFNRLLQGKRFKNIETVFVTKSGKEIIVQGNLNSFIKKGKFINTRGIFRDITEKKNAEVALKKSKENVEKQVIERTKDLEREKNFSQNILNTMPEGVDIVDENLNVRFMNKKFLDIFGEKAIGKKCYGLYKDNKKQCVGCPLRKPIKVGETKMLEVPGVLGGKTFLITHTGIIDANGEKLILEMFTDITNIKENEKKLKQSYTKLKELDKLKSNFLTISSHELKTPLTPTKIQVQMFLEGELGELNVKQKKSFNIIHRNINRLDELIGDILEISKVKAEGFRLKLGNVNIGNCVKEVFKSMEDVAKNKKLKLSYKIYPLPLIFADRKRIIEVLENLVNNAIKFTENGRVIIEAKKQKENILVMIKDTGIGVSKIHLDKIFTPFFQIEPTYTRKYGGTGLGLSIAKGIIEQHKGKMWAKSELGKGSIIYFTLPLKSSIKPVEKKSFLKEKQKLNKIKKLT